MKEFWNVVKFLLLGIVLLAFFCGLLDFAMDTQIYRSVFSGYKIASDSRVPEDGEKIIYHGKLKKLATKDEHYLTNYLYNTSFEQAGTNGFFRVECRDYIIEHYNFSMTMYKYNKKTQRDVPFTYTHRPEITGEVIYSDSYTDDESIRHLLIEKKTGKTYVFANNDFIQWLNVNYGYTYDESYNPVPKPLNNSNSYASGSEWENYDYDNDGDINQYEWEDALGDKMKEYGY